MGFLIFPAPSEILFQRYYHANRYKEILLVDYVVVFASVGWSAQRIWVSSSLCALSKEVCDGCSFDRLYDSCFLASCADIFVVG